MYWTAVPKGHPAIGHMMMNFSANLLGLDNAATPFGLKAMESLQEINPNKTTASNPQIMFLCLHASGMTMIPVSIIAMRTAAKSANPMDIFIPCMIATFIATVASMLIVSFKQKINVFQLVIIAWILGISAIIASIVLYIHQLDSESVQLFSSSLSSGLILAIFILIVLGGIYKKIDREIAIKYYLMGIKNTNDAKSMYELGLLYALNGEVESIKYLLNYYSSLD